MVAVTIQERIAEIVGPLQQEAAKIEREIEQKEAELAALKDGKRQLQAVLARANGTPPGKPGPKRETGYKRGSDKWLPVVRDHLAAMDADEFQIKPVYDALHTEYQDQPLRQRPGYKSVQSAMHALHANGELRIVRKSNGGAPVYARTVKGE